MDGKIVFLNYASKDKEWADWLRTQFRGQGFQVWDPKDTSVGESFIHELIKTIEKADVLVALMSPNYFQSQWCDAQTAIAAAKRVPVIPALIEPCEVSGYLALLTAADLTVDRYRGLERLISGVRHFAHKTAA